MNECHQHQKSLDYLMLTFFLPELRLRHVFSLRVASLLCQPSTGDQTTHNLFTTLLRNVQPLLALRSYFRLQTNFHCLIVEASTLPLEFLPICDINSPLSILPRCRIFLFL